MKTQFRLLMAAALSSGSTLALAGVATAPQDLELKCTASEVIATQPCGGADSRTLKIIFENGTAPSSGYREEVAYGGCYATTSVNFGKIEHVVQNGAVITFDLTPSGVFSSDDDIPVVYDDNTPAIPASLDTKTAVLTLDTSKVFWVYQHANKLSCVPLY